MKGIILAGGKGTRLYPSTISVSKQLIPIYDKPMIYYPMSILMLSGITEILLISTPDDLPLYKKLFGDGSKLGLKMYYEVQTEPRGLADAFIIGEKFIGKDNVCLILGDNIFYGGGITLALNEAINRKKGATIFGYPVKNPSDFGVVEFDDKMNAICIEEKPEVPKSNYAVPGLYFYDNDVVEIAKNVKPSKRGEIEITAINNEYLKNKKLKVVVFGRGMAWLDTGNPRSMNQASLFVEAVQSRQGYYIACLEEIAYVKKFIDLEQLRKDGEELKMTEYGKYILSICEEEDKKSKVVRE